MTGSSRRTRVAVVFGGRSAEHAISCVSAGSVLAALDPDRYEVVPVGITRDGGWVLHDGAALAIEGGRTILLDDEEFREFASYHKLSIVAMTDRTAKTAAA